MVDLSWKGQNVDLNALKSSACRKYGPSHAPKLVEMIAARTPFSPSSEPNPSERPPVSLSSPSCPSPTTAPTSPLPVTFVSTAPVDPIRILSTALSLTGYEPTSMRARYNPYVQARSRVDQLKTMFGLVGLNEMVENGME